MGSRVGVLALVSGGLDSLLLIQTLLRTRTLVVPVYVRGGLVWEAAELLWLRRWLSQIRHPGIEALSVLPVSLRSLYANHWSLTGRGIPSSRHPDSAVYLPGRNVLLLSHAAIYAAHRGLSTLAIGTLDGNPFEDATPAFFRRFGVCLRQALCQSIQITAPLRRWTKAQLIAANPRQPFHLTFSCLRPRGVRHCGRCNKCAERKRAFRQAGVPDPTRYVS